MYVFNFNAFAVVASFRIPESHTFQQTLPLPPVTTLTGIMGAAVGLSFEEALAFRDENGLRFGVMGTHQAEFKDLWKYRKVKAKEILSDVLLREYLADVDLSVYIAADSYEIIAQVRTAFRSPCYALTAGNSDSLMKIRKISDIIQAEETAATQFGNTVLRGNHADNYIPHLDLDKISITESVRAPQVHLLPTAFDISDGRRVVSAQDYFTFIGTGIELKTAVSAIRGEEGNVQLL